MNSLAAALFPLYSRELSPHDAVRTSAASDSAPILCSTEIVDRSIPDGVQHTEAQSVGERTSEIECG
jgi:hypothetical protein